MNLRATATVLPEVGLNLFVSLDDLRRVVRDEVPSESIHRTDFEQQLVVALHQLDSDAQPYVA